jgi:hypothetical protein
MYTAGKRLFNLGVKSCFMPPLVQVSHTRFQKGRRKYIQSGIPGLFKPDFPALLISLPDITCSNSPEHGTNPIKGGSQGVNELQMEVPL